MAWRSIAAVCVSRFKPVEQGKEQILNGVPLQRALPLYVLLRIALRARAITMYAAIGLEKVENADDRGGIVELGQRMGLIQETGTSPYNCSASSVERSSTIVPSSRNANETGRDSFIATSRSSCMSRAQ